MREFIWGFVNDNPELFGIVYPIYLTVLQVITLKCMVIFRLPYRIRLFFVNVCPDFCCRTNNGETPVYYSNYDEYWSGVSWTSMDLKYIEKQKSIQSEKELDKTKEIVQLETIDGTQKKDDDDDMEMNENNKQDVKQTENEEIRNGEKEENASQHNNTDTTIIITKSNTGIASHRYKSTELELTVEDVWSNDILFVAGGMFYVLLKREYLKVIFVVYNKGQ